MAQNEGKKFEADFIKSMPDDVYHYRLKDGSASWGGNEKTRFQATNDFDFFMHYQEIIYGLELKSVKGKSLPYSNIKKNQWEGLERINNHYHGRGYFIINFRQIEETYSVGVATLLEYKKNCSKKSINALEVKEIGVLIPQRKKISRYGYDIEGWIGRLE